MLEKERHWWLDPLALGREKICGHESGASKGVGCKLSGLSG